TITHGLGYDSIKFSICHIYHKYGNFYVSFDVTPAHTSCYYQFLIKIPPFLQTTFNFTNNCLGKPTSFTSQSSVPVATWNWDFGNGSTSTDSFPTYTYPTAGTYTVTLVTRSIS